MPISIIVGYAIRLCQHLRRHRLIRIIRVKRIDDLAACHFQITLGLGDRVVPRQRSRLECVVKGVLARARNRL